MKALEVSVDGKVIGIFVPAADKSFVAGVGNIPGSYMRAHVMSGNETEHWQWQLPDVNEGQTISFRMIEAEPGSYTPSIRPAEGPRGDRRNQAPGCRRLRPSPEGARSGIRVRGTGSNPAILDERRPSFR